MSASGNSYTNKKIELDGFSVMLREDGIIEVNISEGAEMDVSHTKQGVEQVKNIGKGKKFPHLFIAGKFSVPTEEARNYNALPESNPYASAEAYVITTLSQKLIGNFYLIINKPARPTKFFTDVESAVEWLKGFL